MSWPFVINDCQRLSYPVYAEEYLISPFVSTMTSDLHKFRASVGQIFKQEIGAFYNHRYHNPPPDGPPFRTAEHARHNILMSKTKNIIFSAYEEMTLPND